MNGNGVFVVQREAVDRVALVARPGRQRGGTGLNSAAPTKGAATKSSEEAIKALVEAQAHDRKALNGNTWTTVVQDKGF